MLGNPGRSYRTPYKSIYMSCNVFAYLLILQHAFIFMKLDVFTHVKDLASLFIWANSIAQDPAVRYVLTPHGSVTVTEHSEPVLTAMIMPHTAVADGTHDVST